MHDSLQNWGSLVVEGLPYPQSYPGRDNFAFILLYLDGECLHGTFHIRPFLRDRVIPGDETTFSRVNTLTVEDNSLGTL